MTPYKSNFEVFAIWIEDVKKSPNLRWKNPIALAHNDTKLDLK